MTNPTTPSRRRARAPATAASGTLPDHRIHDLGSFNQTTGEGHEVAGLYFYQQLDCLVDLAYKVSCDFFKRPHLYITVDGLSETVDGLSETLARLHARYGADETLPSGAQRDAIFVPIFGSGGERTLPSGVFADQDTGDFPALRDELLMSAQAFAERQSNAGVQMLGQRVKDAHKPMAQYLNGLEGDSVRWSRFHALPTLTENVSYTILRSGGIAAVFGTPAPTRDFPYVEEFAGQKLVENIWKQLAGIEHPVLNRDLISNLQRLALRGAEAIATIIDFQENLSNSDLDLLITKLYTWDAALWGVKASAAPQVATGAPPDGATPPAQAATSSPTAAGMGTVYGAPRP
jgi:hypothetical protein